MSYRIAKSLWVQQWNSVSGDFVEVLREHCRSELRMIFQDPFSSLDPRLTVKDICSYLVLMVRRSTPAKVYDEQTFAVRVRFSIPERGFTRLNEVNDWLRQRTNRQYAIHSTTAIRQCAFLHVNDLAVALECVKLFDMELVGLPKQTP